MMITSYSDAEDPKRLIAMYFGTQQPVIENDIYFHTSANMADV